jgi:UDP-GlcNAc:undecaprenyl-phosphate GlcNAc-1-phosphate transferase
MNLPDWLLSLLWLFGCPLLISGLLTALLIRWAPRLRLVDYPSARKVHTQPTPRGGGLAIFAAVSLSLLLLSLFTFHFSVFNFQFFLSLTIVLLGLLDDLRPLPWQLRLAIQLAVSLAAVLFSLPPLDGWLRILALFWIAGLINAFNMLDNMDALSGGVAWIGAGFLALLGWHAPAPNTVVWGPFVVLMGALSGFLWFNRPPARIFMGDAGSTFLGFALGLGSVQLAVREEHPPWSLLAPLCILAVPCYDLLTVVLLRLSQGRSPFHADKQHLSHRLVGRGLSGWTAVRVIYLLALASGVSGVLLYAVASWPAALLIAGQLAVWWLALAGMEFATKESAYVSKAQDPAGRDPASPGA